MMADRARGSDAALILPAYCRFARRALRGECSAVALRTT
jgi:hypothetical protein